MFYDFPHFYAHLLFSIYLALLLYFVHASPLPLCLLIQRRGGGGYVAGAVMTGDIAKMILVVLYGLKLP
jgi:hypothetical protein